MVCVLKYDSALLIIQPSLFKVFIYLCAMQIIKNVLYSLHGLPPPTAQQKTNKLASFWRSGREPVIIVLFSHVGIIDLFVLRLIGRLPARILHSRKRTTLALMGGEIVSSPACTLFFLGGGGQS